VLKGVTLPREVEREREKRVSWMREFLKSKLGVECEISVVRRSGPVMVVKIEGEVGKREVMKNKHKLKRGNVYIENDLSYEERKIQEYLNRWAKEKRKEGFTVKVRRGGAKIGGRWASWEEIEKDEKEKRLRREIGGEEEGKEQRRKEGEEEEGEEKQDFG